MTSQAQRPGLAHMHLRNVLIDQHLQHAAIGIGEKQLGSDPDFSNQVFLRALGFLAGFTLDASKDMGVGCAVLTKPTLEKLTRAVGA